MMEAIYLIAPTSESANLLLQDFQTDKLAKYGCLCGCLYVGVYVCMYVWVYEWVYVWVYVWVFVCVRVCMYTHT